jgi:Arylsulfatase A and related enzymes
MNQENKPNVLMISVDHWASSFFGCEGRSDIETPTLDYLSQNGIKFENCYSECPVCIPARRTLMTGLSPKTHGDRVYSDRMEMPAVTTMAQAFRDNGYQAYAVGKLHVYPQRNRIGFDDVILTEEGRYEFGVTDDYQKWLAENGHPGEEFMHGMGNNTYYTRPWHLEEKAHPTAWVTKMMMDTIKRKDPTRPAFFYCSYQFPHPPLVPLETFLKMYEDKELRAEVEDDWCDERYIFKALTDSASAYGKVERDRARKAFFAQCTHIDYSIRMLLGTLRECELLDNTIIVFLSDHGDMLFDHNMVAKRLMYDNSACVPLIFSGKPMLKYNKAGFETKLAGLGDVMPTILSICGLEVPSTVEGINLFSDKAHEYLYSECGEGEKATRMIRDEKFKLIYYPCGNVIQLFDMERDRLEQHDLARLKDYDAVRSRLEKELTARLYGKDAEWVKNGKLIGFSAPAHFVPKVDFGLYNQRGYHFPAPAGYSNLGKNG